MTLKTNDIPNVQYKILFSHLENLFNVYEDTDGQYFYNILKTVSIPEEIGPEFFDYYTVGQDDMWPIIAYRFYNNVSLWWLICSANQIQDATQKPEAGTVLKIIKNEYVTDILNKISGQ